MNKKIDGFKMMDNEKMEMDVLLTNLFNISDILLKSYKKEDNSLNRGQLNFNIVRIETILRLLKEKIRIG